MPATTKKRTDAGRQPLTCGQVARILNVSSARVGQLAAEGRLDFTWTPLGRLFSAESVDRLAQERQVQAEHDARVRPPAIRS